MFIESYRQAQGQVKPDHSPASRPRLLVTKEGNLHYVLGGMALIASFFLPALRAGELVYSPYHVLTTSNLALKLAPFMYLLGLSTTLMIGMGRFRKDGIPTHLIGIHLVLSIALILGTGVILHIGLITSGKRFGVTLMPLALLCWWPLFIRFVLTWVWGKRAFLTRMLSTTWISAACCGLMFLIVGLDVYYYKKYQLSYGLVLSAVGTLMITIGGHKNERSSLRG
jgi:hypothetical protein